MAITLYDERALLTHPTDGVVQVLRDGDTVEWAGYHAIDDWRRTGIGGSQTGTLAEVVRDLAAAGYVIEEHDDAGDEASRRAVRQAEREGFAAMVVAGLTAAEERAGSGRTWTIAESHAAVRAYLATTTPTGDPR